MLRKNTPRNLERELDAVETLLGEGEHDEAMRRLSALSKQYPKFAEPLEMMATEAMEAGDYDNALHAAILLMDLRPREEMPLSTAVYGALHRQHPFYSYRLYKRLMKNFPNPASLKNAADMQEVYDTLLPESLRQMGLPKDEAGLEFAGDHDLSQILMGIDPLKGEAIARRLIAERPDFIPSYNNLSLLLFIQNKVAEAVEIARAAVAADPANINAHSNLIRYLLLLGKPDEAATHARALREMDMSKALRQNQVKAIEGLSYTGDDEGIARLAENIDLESYAENSPKKDTALLFHLLAVAKMNLRQADEAEKLWERALKLDPDNEEIAGNLDQLDLPEHERNAAWPFDMSMWLQPKTIKDIKNIYDAHGQKNGSEKRLAAEVRRYLEQNSQVKNVMPHVLQRGDPNGIMLFTKLASTSQYLPMLKILEEFAQGQRGTDQQRSAALMAARKESDDQSPVRFWMRGEWTEISVVGTYIHGESKGQHTPQVKKLAEQGMEALEQRQSAKAIPLFEKALELSPGAQDLRFNLSVAYEQEGKVDEAREIVEKLYAEDPEYVFSRVAVAKYMANEGGFDEAEGLILALAKRERMHYTEHFAIFSALVEIAVKRGEVEKAEGYLSILASTHGEDDPRIDNLWRMIEKKKKALTGGQKSINAGLARLLAQNLKSLKQEK